ncbi:Anp1 [Penicillium mononematosum]|uniref:Anp1 n=1 Tax=Penicillium mononematosum TaxID=268346 RepID=UPI002548247B|nr:Anp1 [Penicillium mononematosum]KAJ6178641.1 Anp1 [Penicillium mononematosum]
MAVARSMRRTSPISLVLAALLAFGFICFLLSPSTPSASSASASSQQRQENAAEHPLSPPTKPFFKSQPVRSDGYKAAPPGCPLRPQQPNQHRGLTDLPGIHRTEDKRGNAAVAALEKAIAKTQSGPIDNRFASISILRQDFEPPLKSQDEKARHAMAAQKERRESMSRARNSLVFTTLGPGTSWVLWLDSDIVETPATLIQDLTGFDQPVIVPNCFQRYYDSSKKKWDVRPYDYNSWVDSQTAQNLAANMGPDEILLEGYAEMPTYRTLMAHLPDMKKLDPKKMLALDGVGGTALLVKADVHRDGAMFPAFPFFHLVETEGFAKMARRLGYEVIGLPDYFVYHYNE